MFNWNIFRDPVMPRPNAFKYEPRRKNLRFGVRPGNTQTGQLVSWNFGFRQFSYYTIEPAAQNKGSDQTARGSYEPPHDKTNKMPVRSAKTQISLGIRPVWSESSLCAQWVGMIPAFFMRTAKTLIRLGECPGWTEYSLSAHAILLVLSWGGSITLVAYWSHVSWHCFHNEVLIGLSKYTDIYG